jgi:aerobic-type carbon monoxide dehydrogenase small subunit (CoxS/CutS family)
MTELAELRVNGRTHRVAADPATPLIYILRNDLGLKGVRFGCGSGECGACTVLVGDAAERSCQAPLWSVQGREVTTIEGMADGGQLSALQQAMLAHQAAQCAYCASGVIMAATALLRANPHPSELEVRKALDRNLCRCGAHGRMLAAVMSAAEAGS